MYTNSHYVHHACRPLTTFAGTSADVFEIMLNGHGSTLFPILVLPMYSRDYLTMILFTEFWTMYLHNSKAHKMPAGVYDCFDHNVHHYYGKDNYNFGLFFQFWDKAMGTYKGAITGSSKLSVTKMENNEKQTFSE